MGVTFTESVCLQRSETWYHKSCETTDYCEVLLLCGTASGVC